MDLGQWSISLCINFPDEYATQEAWDLHVPCQLACESDLMESRKEVDIELNVY